MDKLDVACEPQSSEVSEALYGVLFDRMYPNEAIDLNLTLYTAQVPAKVSLADLKHGSIFNLMAKNPDGSTAKCIISLNGDILGKDPIDPTMFDLAQSAAEQLRKIAEKIVQENFMKFLPGVDSELECKLDGGKIPATVSFGETQHFETLVLKLKLPEGEKTILFGTDFQLLGAGFKIPGISFEDREMAERYLDELALIMRTKVRARKLLKRED